MRRCRGCWRVNGSRRMGDLLRHGRGQYCITVVRVVSRTGSGLAAVHKSFIAYTYNTALCCLVYIYRANYSVDASMLNRRQQAG